MIRKEMKKIYSKPNMKVAMLDTTDILLTNSNLEGLQDEGFNLDPYDDTQGSGLSRENTNLWDQEW